MLVLFSEAFSHPYISFFHILVNGFSVINIYSCTWTTDLWYQTDELQGSFRIIMNIITVNMPDIYISTKAPVIVSDKLPAK